MFILDDQLEYNEWYKLFFGCGPDNIFESLGVYISGGERNSLLRERGYNIPFILINEPAIKKTAATVGESEKNVLIQVLVHEYGHHVFRIENTRISYDTRLGKLISEGAANYFVYMMEDAELRRGLEKMTANFFPDSPYRAYERLRERAQDDASMKLPVNSLSRSLLDWAKGNGESAVQDHAYYLLYLFFVTEDFEVIARMVNGEPFLWDTVKEVLASDGRVKRIEQIQPKFIKQIQKAIELESVAD